MAEGLSREWLRELSGKLDIVAVIGRYIPLAKKGRQFWGRCPFHHEKTPSFAVNESTQFYHCFGCGESGDVIKFVQKQESLDFMSTVKLLADQAGMQLPAFDPERDRQLVDAKKKRDEILSVNKLAAQRYHANLTRPEGAAAARYLETRGITPAMVRRFGLGVSIDFSDMPDYLKSQKCNLDLAKEGGLLGQKDGSGSFYDSFGGRLMFPIVDSMANVVAFGGRLLEKSDFAKYRNTSNTPVFDKSKNIYAINLIKKLKQTKNLEYIILCEGYIDVIALHQAGFDTAVASMGTSLTREQARLLHRFCNRVIISYDGDTAGQKATMRGLDILKEEGLDIKVLRLPEGLDPDDLIKQRGADAYSDLIKRAEPYFDFKLSNIASAFDLKTMDGKTRYTTAALDAVRQLSGPVEQEEYLRRIQQMTGYTFESLKSQLGDPVSDNVKLVPTTGRITDKYEKAARYLLFSLINGFDYADAALPIRDYLTDDDEKTVYDCFRENPGITVDAAFQTLDEALHTALGNIASDNQGVEDDTTQREYYRGCVNIIMTDHLQHETEDVLKRHTESGDPEEKKRLLSEYAKLLQEKKKYQR